MEEILSTGLYHVYFDPYVFENLLASLRNTHLEWVVMALYKFGPLVSPQFPSLNYVANITGEYSFINPTDLEMHQVLFKELLIQTP